QLGRRPMFRAARPRLRLEPCEDRALPAAVTPTTPPYAHQSVQSPADSGGTTAYRSDKASEYTNQKSTASNSKSSDGGRKYPEPAEAPQAEAAEYAPASLPAAPPLPIGPKIPMGPAVTVPPPSNRPGPAIVVMSEGPVAPVAVPPVPPPPPLP